jgi:integrase/recombinase XerD
MTSVVIERFLDYYWVRHGVSNSTLETYRNDLTALDGWMARFRGTTLVGATEADIREFITAAWRAGAANLRELPSLSCVKRFYFYLLEGKFRDDDPTESVFMRTPRLVSNTKNLRGTTCHSIQSIGSEL